MRRIGRRTVGFGLFLLLAGCGGEAPVPTPTPVPVVHVSPAERREAELDRLRSVLLGDLENEVEVMTAMLVLESMEKPLEVSERVERNSLTGRESVRVTERYEAAGLVVVRLDGQVLNVSTLAGPVAAPLDFSSTMRLE